MNPNQIREIVREACEQAGAAGLLGQYGLAPWEEIVDRAVERIVALAEGDDAMIRRHRQVGNLNCLMCRGLIGVWIAGNLVECPACFPPKRTFTTNGTIPIRPFVKDKTP